MLEWVEDVHRKFLHRNLLYKMDYKAWMIVILKATVPGQHEPPCYQFAMEGLPGETTSTFVRPYAIRAATGIAARTFWTRTGLLRLSHMTYLRTRRVSSISQKQTVCSAFSQWACALGAEKGEKRMDVHVMAFFP